MLLIVSANIQIPHFSGSDKFNPYCEVDDVKGKSMLKAYPKIYRKITEEELKSLDLTRWIQVDVLKGKTLVEIVSTVLTEDQKQKVLEFVKQILAPVIPKSKKPQVTLSEELTIADMRAFAEENKIEIPDTITKKGDILAFLLEKTKKVE
jgi:hypothetical protein